MKRNRQVKKVDAILTSDWHLREDQPPCRVDDFWEAQWDKVNQVSELQKQHNCPVIHAGDLYHHWKPSPYLLAKTIENIPARFYTVFGQHDLPQHNFELREKSGINVLWAAGVINDIDGGSWGDSGPGCTEYFIHVWHKFVWDGKKLPWPGCEEMTAMEIMDKYSFDVLVTGDHHKPFTYSINNRVLVNPGCLTRQASDYANHQPRVYLYHAEDNTLTPHYLRTSGPEAISDVHIQIKKDRDERIEAFVSRLSDEFEVSLSFEENLKRFLSKNRIKKPIVDLIYEATE